MFVWFPTLFLCTPVSHCLITPCVSKPVMFPRSLLVSSVSPHQFRFHPASVCWTCLFVACFWDLGFLVTSLWHSAYCSFTSLFRCVNVCVFVSVFAKPDRYRLYNLQNLGPKVMCSTMGVQHSSTGLVRTPSHPSCWLAVFSLIDNRGTWAVSHEKEFIIWKMFLFLWAKSFFIPNLALWSILSVLLRTFINKGSSALMRSERYAAFRIDVTSTLPLMIKQKNVKNMKTVITVQKKGSTLGRIMC